MCSEWVRVVTLRREPWITEWITIRWLMLLSQQHHDSINLMRTADQIGSDPFILPPKCYALIMNAMH